MIISSKKIMYERLRAGLLGNSFRIWTDVDEFAKSNFRGLTGVRIQGMIPGLPYFHHLNFQQTVEKFYELKRQGYTPIIYEASDDPHIVWQGEVTRASWSCGWHVEYSRAKTHMRAAFAVERLCVTGYSATVLLQNTLTPSSFADLEDLMDLYEDHVIELTVYDQCVGQFPDRNYCLWEVRKY